MQEAVFHPIGVIRSPFTELALVPKRPIDPVTSRGEVVLDPRYREGLADLKGFSHVILVFHLHRSHGYDLTVSPYLDPTPRGLFATRAPRRPNPIGMTVVRLLRVDGPRLRVRGVDVLDGTPLLDIKPSVPAFDHHPCERCGWLEPHLPELERGGSARLADGRFHEEDA